MSKKISALNVVCQELLKRDLRTLKFLLNWAGKKGFKKPININRWLKLIMLDWRFHYLTESQFKERRNKSPLELAGCELPKIHNWVKFVYKNYRKPRT